MAKLSCYLYTLVLALWIGGMALFTFVVTPVIFRSFTRDLAGEVVGKLFPGYFSFNLILSITALVLLFASGPWLSRTARTWSLLLVALAIVVNVSVTFILHPAIVKVKQEVLSFEKVSPDSPLRKRFRELHGVSAALNLMLLADGVALLFVSTCLRRP